MKTSEPVTAWTLQGSYQPLPRAHLARTNPGIHYHVNPEIVKRGRLLGFFLLIFVFGEDPSKCKCEPYFFKKKSPHDKGAKKKIVRTVKKYLHQHKGVSRQRFKTVAESCVDQVFFLKRSFYAFEIVQKCGLDRVQKKNDFFREQKKGVSAVEGVSC